MRACEPRDPGEMICDNGLHIIKLDDTGSDWLVSAETMPMGVWKRDLGKRFTTLRAARAAAVHIEVVRLRRIKQARHVALASVFFVAAVWFYHLMALPAQWYRVELFAAATIALVVALSEGLAAFLMVIDDGWDYLYEVPRITFLDRAIAALLLSYPSPRRGTDDPLDARVRIVHDRGGSLETRWR